jgi:ATP-dependent helicase/nuclease subunit A
MIRDAASLRQVQAADPAASTWLAANAGSGKTSVLTDRVARLLLNHVDPTGILCLTYTKAAAYEMQNRLFNRLGSWAMLDDAPLSAALQKLGLDRRLAPEDLNHARRLFARAIETPGGLRIQTIHSFCAGLLRRFPLEAGVSPQFTEMEDRAASLLREAVVEDLAAGPDAACVAGIAALSSDDDLGPLIADIARKRAAFDPPMDRPACLAAFGLPGTLTQDDLLADVFLGDEGDWIPVVIAKLCMGRVTDLKNADRLSSLNFEAPDCAVLTQLEDLFLTGAGTKIPFGAKTDAIPTKDLRPGMGDTLDRLHALMRRVESTRQKHLAFAAAEKTHALHRFAARFLPEYAARKAARAALDFDDLIAKAKALLTAKDVAQWVLYRLDGGINHILVDEAQDTSPDQWAVIRLLAEEIIATPDSGRTFFVVGDIKQSIYSFQGANVEDFHAMHAFFDHRITEAEGSLAKLTLEHSFRSSPGILGLVDATLGDATGETAMGGAFRHSAHRDAMPGRVELWPPILKEPIPEPAAWDDPVDLTSPQDPAVLLGAKIAARIRSIIGTTIPAKKGDRPATPGDILILVRRRSGVFHQIIRALKQAGLPVAGSDRLKLGGELAVRDLASLLAFLATPEDDLALAEALRSPLFNWTEAQIYALAQPRSGYLWEALRAQGDAHPDTMAILTDLRDLTDYLRPYDLIERMLTRHDGRRRILARLGPEAEDGVDALLSQALAYERSDVPSLTGFLGWLTTEEVEVKRQPDSAGGLIRVMTVHGAKGLEAPIVILPDTADRMYQDRDRLIGMGASLVWKPNKDEAPDAVRQATARRREAADRESLRLMYVAMTRAQSWLIVAAAGNLKSHGSKPDTTEETEGAWYDRIKAGMERSHATATAEGGLDLRFGDWPDTPLPGETGHTAEAEPLPTFALTAAPAAQRPIKPVSPSDLGGAKTLPGEPDGDPDARQRGTDLHSLLERLPAASPDTWPALAESLIPDSTALLADATRILTTPALAPIFAPGTLAEVAITADLDGTPMLGSIDRLIIGQTSILAVDYKSNRVEADSPDQVPEGLRRQMRAYALALRQIYPDRTVQVAILWTGSARLMPLPDL